MKNSVGTLKKKKMRYVFHFSTTEQTKHPRLIQNASSNYLGCVW